MASESTNPELPENNILGVGMPENKPGAGLLS